MYSSVDSTGAPLVTVLVPTYNRAQLLQQTLKSVQNQTYQNLEVLVLDDASPDDTPAMLRQFASDPRIKHVRRPTNLGIGENWKSGIREVSGEFFCIIDDDDTLEPEFIETLLQPLLEDASLILSFCSQWIMDADGVRQPQQSDRHDQRWKLDTLNRGHLPEFARSALADQSIWVGATLFRRSLVSPQFINTQARSTVDIWLLYNCVKTGYCAYYIPEKLRNYRHYRGGMSQQRSWRSAMIEGDLFRYRRMLADSSLSHLHPLFKSKLAARLVDYGLGLMLIGEPAQAQRVLAQSLQLERRPLTVAAYSLSLFGPLGTAAIGSIRNLRRPHPSALSE